MAGGLVVALTLGLVLISIGPAEATHVDPIPVDGNANCEGLTGIEELHREEDPEDGSQEVVIDGVTYTISWDVHEDNSFDWWTSGGLLIQAVFAKGGAGGGGNLYDYRPLGGETSDTGLHALKNPSGTLAELSHISFCGDVEEPTTTTTTVASTTTTTVASTTTTTVASTTTTTVASTTTTTVASTVSSDTTTPTTTATTGEPTTTIQDEVLPSEVLPFTGPEDTHVGLFALSLSALGLMLVVGERAIRVTPWGMLFAWRRRCRKCRREAMLMTPQGKMCVHHTRRALRDSPELWLPIRLDRR